MKYALHNNEKIIAKPQTIDNLDYPRSAECLCCGSPVIAKTGNKMIHHWAHKSTKDCQYSKYSKNKGEWHYYWQDLFESHEQEVRNEKWPNNIADICIYDERLPDGYLVVELQKSKIKLDKVLARNAAYKNIMWIAYNKIQQSLLEVRDKQNVLVMSNTFDEDLYTIQSGLNTFDSKTNIFNYYSTEEIIEKEWFRDYIIESYLHHINVTLPHIAEVKNDGETLTFPEFLIKRLKTKPKLHHIGDTYGSPNRKFICYSLRRLFDKFDIDPIPYFLDLDTHMKYPASKTDAESIFTLSSSVRSTLCNNFEKFLDKYEQYYYFQLRASCEIKPRNILAKFHPLKHIEIKSPVVEPPPSKPVLNEPTDNEKIFQENYTPKMWDLLKLTNSSIVDNKPWLDALKGN